MYKQMLSVGKEILENRQQPEGEDLVVQQQLVDGPAQVEIEQIRQKAAARRTNKFIALGVVATTGIFGGAGYGIYKVVNGIGNGIDHVGDAVGNALDRLDGNKQYSAVVQSAIDHMKPVDKLVIASGAGESVGEVRVDGGLPLVGCIIACLSHHEVTEKRVGPIEIRGENPKFGTNGYTEKAIELHPHQKESKQGAEGWYTVAIMHTDDFEATRLAMKTPIKNPQYDKNGKLIGGEPEVHASDNAISKLAGAGITALTLGQHQDQSAVKRASLIENYTDQSFEASCAKTVSQQSSDLEASVENNVRGQYWANVELIMNTPGVSEQQKQKFAEIYAQLAKAPITVKYVVGHGRGVREIRPDQVVIKSSPVMSKAEAAVRLGVDEKRVHLTPNTSCTVRPIEIDKARQAVTSAPVAE